MSSHTLLRLGLPREQVLTRAIDVRARAHDASHFLLYPRAVVVPRSADEVASLLRGCARTGLGVTFRSGGTSLSGQAGTDSVLADVRRHFDSIEVLDGGLRVRVQPGVTVNRVNAHLAAYGRQIGPDPASAAACTIGGVVANNSSGMACGTAENAYRTIESLVVVLASGNVIDTGASDADERLRLTEPGLYEGLIRLRQRVLGNADSLSRITQQFSMKNTMGYGLNSLTDHASPVDILTHLMIGSEGTLGFIASATFRTVSVRPYAQTGLLVFADLAHANQALPSLVGTHAATLELMDTASIRVGQGLPDCPASIAAIHTHQQAVLLVEYQSDDPADLAEQVAAASGVLAGLPVESPVRLTGDPAQRADLWALRKGLYTAVSAARRPGTTALLEDVVVPVGRLTDTCEELTRLFTQFSYDDSVIFGHAKDGNIHFMITDEFEKQIERYAGFTDAMVDLVLGQGGSLKAEHGTGRVMAPFVRKQYGDELYAVMVEIKELFDPAHLLNDGVVLTHDPQAHLKHIKAPVPVDPLVDACVECGYCEPTCPSRTLTLTPRQRIATQREIRRALATGETSLAAELEREFVYDGVQTCAVDGLCGLACPVHIDTGAYIKSRRAEMAPGIAQSLWATAAEHWGGGTHLASFALSTAGSTPVLAPAVKAVTRVGRHLLGPDQVPLWTPDLPRGGRSRTRPKPNRTPEAVYIPACVNAMFGPVTEGVQVAFERLCAAAGLPLVVPDNIDSLCCGTPWSSKGMTDGYAVMAERVRASVRETSGNGQLPIVCDASSCTQGLARILADDPALRVIDAVQFVAEQVLPRIGPIDMVPSLTLHLTCSSTELNINPYLLQVAKAVAQQVNVPKDGGCCAFAGDRGMLHPELTHAATRPEAAEVATLNATNHASCNRTCEIGMSRATGEPYHHVLELLAARLPSA